MTLGEGGGEQYEAEDGLMHTAVFLSKANKNCSTKGHVRDTCPEPDKCYNCLEEVKRTARSRPSAGDAGKEVTKLPTVLSQCAAASVAKRVT